MPYLGRMNFKLVNFLYAAGVLLLSACRSLPQNGITQVYTINALLAGGYEGHVRLDTLSQAGDIGLGTFNHLDGEMVLLDGIFYQVDVAGRVREMPQDTLTPFAAVTRFEPDIFATVDQPLDLNGLQEMLDDLVPDLNRFAVIRIEGDFLRIRTRSVAAQTPPYRPLAEVVKTQTVFDLENVSGTLVGFRGPPFVSGWNVPGYHFHFLTQDRDTGGHVLSLDLRRGRIQIDSLHDWIKVMLPVTLPAEPQADAAAVLNHNIQATEPAN